MRHVYNITNEYLDKAYQDLGIETEIEFESVRNANDYGELLKIANTSNDELESLAARRKIELSWLVLSSKNCYLYVKRRVFANKIKSRFEVMNEGIRMLNDEPERIIDFWDIPKCEEYPDGEICIAKEGDEEKFALLGTKRKATLFPAIVGKKNTRCWCLPAVGEKISNNPREYFGLKSIQSIITKLIHREKVRAKDITDILRITLDLDDIASLMEIQEYVEDNYLSFGRTLKRENRYGEFIQVTSFDVENSAHKSSQYRSLRYVVDVPIYDEVGDEILVPIELRLLLTEDLLKELSHYHDASHIKYEEKRLRSNVAVLEPYEKVPGLYKEVNPFNGELGPHWADIFKRTEIVLKDRSDFLKKPITKPHSKTPPGFLQPAP